MNALTASWPLRAARWIVIASLPALMVSPPLTNLLQALLLALMLGSPELRARLWAARHQPMVQGALAFFAVLVAGAFYGAATPADGFGMVWGWRKLLLVPLAAALFDDARWKTRLLCVFVAVSAVTALAALVLGLLQIPLPVAARVPGVIVRNHATQGVVFAAAAFAAAALALFNLDTGARRRVLWAGCGVVILAALLLVTPGRSGYVVLLAGAAAMAIGWTLAARRSLLVAAAAAVVLVAVAAGLLAASPVARQRIQQGVDEMRTYTEASELTSMGIRMYFWQNSLALIAQKPVFGWGTGAFEVAYAGEVAGRPGLAGTTTSDPHNQFLKIAAEHGLVGLAVFLGFLVTLTRQRTALPWRVLGLGAALGWCGTSLASSHFSTFAEGTLIYLWLGAVLARERDPTA